MIFEEAYVWGKELINSSLDSIDGSSFGVGMISQRYVLSVPCIIYVVKNGIPTSFSFWIAISTTSLAAA